MGMQVTGDFRLFLHRKWACLLSVFYFLPPGRGHSGDPSDRGKLSAAPPRAAQRSTASWAVCAPQRSKHLGSLNHCSMGNRYIRGRWAAAIGFCKIQGWFRAARGARFAPTPVTSRRSWKWETFAICSVGSWGLLRARGEWAKSPLLAQELYQQEM